MRSRPRDSYRGFDCEDVQSFSGIAADLVALHRKSIDEFFFQYGLEVVLNPSIEIERLDDNRNYCCVAVGRVEHLTNLIVEEISACSGAGSDRHNTGACIQYDSAGGRRHIEAKNGTFMGPAISVDVNLGTDFRVGHAVKCVIGQNVRDVCPHRSVDRQRCVIDCHDQPRQAGSP